ncbi:MAG: hypothetical protein Q7R73_01210 [bacterium]|nr:hypothetical protein [bacterium]
MTPERLEKIIRDPSVTDDEVLQAIEECKKYMTAQKQADPDGKILMSPDEMITDLETVAHLGLLTRRLRPAVMNRFEERLGKQYGDCQK